MDPFSLFVFATALFVAAGSPGPNIAALVARVLSTGWRDVLPFLAALWIGELIWLTCAIVGLAAVAQTFHLLFVVLKWLGVAYLLWLAWKMWTAPVVSDAADLPKRASAGAMFGAGLAVTLGNPKIMVFYLALLPTLIDIGAVTPASFAVIAVVTLVVLVVVDCAWVLAAQIARGFLRSPRAVRATNRASATAMGTAAVLIATR